MMTSYGLIDISIPSAFIHLFLEKHIWFFKFVGQQLFSEE